jgi:hypothetical protein
MSHAFHISDDLYANIAAYTYGSDETPETLFQYWVQGKIDHLKVLGSKPREPIHLRKQDNEEDETCSESFLATLSKIGIDKAMKDGKVTFHTFCVSDEKYANLVKHEEWYGETLESVFARWVGAFADWMGFRQSCLRQQAGLEEEREDLDDPFSRQIRMIAAKYTNLPKVTYIPLI